MNLRQIEYFVQVAEHGSFSRAARLLRVAQPALSRQVRQLETDLRQALLLRNGRGVTLTEAGQRLYEHGVAILQQVVQAREDIGARRDEPAGRIAIGLPPSLGRQLTLPLIAGFERALPRARLAVVEGLSSYIAEWIASGRVDLGVLHNPQAEGALELAPLVREPLCLVQPAKPGPRGRAGSTPQRSRPSSLPLAALAGHRLIVPERSQALRRLLDTQAAHAGVPLDIVWEVSSVPSIIDLVRAGHGHAVLPASAVAASGHAGELLARPLVDPPVTSMLCLARAAARRPTPLLRAAAALLADLVRGLPGTERIGPPASPAG